MNAWKKSVLILLLTLIMLSGCLSDGNIEDQGTRPVSNDGGRVTQINDLIRNADTAVNDAFQANLDKDFDGARKKSLEAKSKLKEIRDLMDETGLSSEENEHLATFIEYEQRWSTLLYKTANIDEAAHKTMQSLDEGARFEDIVPNLELLQRGYQENAHDWRDFADYVNSLKGFREEQGISDENVMVLYDLADSTEALATEMGLIIDDYKVKTPEYTSVSEREIKPSSEPEEPTGIMTEELARFFDGFDTNNDNKLSIGEAQEFYYWVENNIQYRYDFEGEPEPVVGTAVGDGRPGSDYRQKPAETLKESAGDCEDMSTLEQAFYRYFGIDAYVVGVNAEEPDVLDHAAAIVWIADKTDLFRNMLGDLVYYEIGEEATDIYGDPIRPGVYMLVDNAYSGALGYLSGGLKPGTFRIHCAIPLERGYDDWGSVVNSCGVPMD